MLIRERIKQERVTWGMSRHDLAEVSGIAYPRIVALEAGAGAADFGELATLAGVFKLTVIELRAHTTATTSPAQDWFEKCIDNSLFVRRVEQLYKD